MDTSPLDPSLPEFAGRLARMEQDAQVIERRWPLEFSPEHCKVWREWIKDMQYLAMSSDWAALSPDERVNAWLLKLAIAKKEAEIDRRTALRDRVPSLERAWKILAKRPQGEPINGPEIAAEIEAFRQDLIAIFPMDRSRVERREIFIVLETVVKGFQDWREHYLGYDPQLDFWIKEPLDSLQKELEATLEAAIPEAERKSLEWIGQPLGPKELQREIDLELLGHTPAQLLSLAEKEWAWCERQMSAIARELNVGSWHEVLELVKNDFAPVGTQAELVRELCFEAIDYLDEHDLVTIPILAREGWRLQRISPELQKEAPFLLGGESVWVSMPHADMSHELKTMVLRSNNRSFTRAVAHHELIPGHHLQGFMMARSHAYRAPFATPFWIEGWTLYWELLLWERGFGRTPFERAGMIFWRSHRCARILFSLRFHLGEMTAEECVELLVDRVGHERATAEAEVRRSFAGNYPPLYQAAYLLGGLQMMALRREMESQKGFNDLDFHDAILRQNAMPIPLLRLRLTGQPIPENNLPDWNWPELGASRD